MGGYGLRASSPHARSPVGRAGISNGYDKWTRQELIAWKWVHGSSDPQGGAELMLQWWRYDGWRRCVDVAPRRNIDVHAPKPRDARRPLPSAAIAK